MGRDRQSYQYHRRAHSRFALGDIIAHLSSPRRPPSPPLSNCHPTASERIPRGNRTLNPPTCRQYLRRASATDPPVSSTLLPPNIRHRLSHLPRSIDIVRGGTGRVSPCVPSHRPPMMMTKMSFIVCTIAVLCQANGELPYSMANVPVCPSSQVKATNLLKIVTHARLRQNSTCVMMCRMILTLYAVCELRIFCHKRTTLCDK